MLFIYPFIHSKVSTACVLEPGTLLRTVDTLMSKIEKASLCKSCFSSGNKYCFTAEINTLEINYISIKHILKKEHGIHICVGSKTTIKVQSNSK